MEVDGWTTTITANNDFVVVRGPSIGSYSEARRQALRAVNLGLDYLAVTGHDDMLVIDPDDDSIVWWSSGRTLTLRLNMVLRSRMDFWGTGKVVGPDGLPVPVVSPSPVVTSAMRFLRTSRASESLNDAYRNMFLALENILSDVRPKQKRERGGWESETDWLEAALRAADEFVDHAELAPKGVSDPMGWIKTTSYALERSGLMHAKIDQNYHLPGQDEYRDKLIESVSRMWFYVRRLIAARLGTFPPHDGTPAATRAQLSRAVLQDMELHISEDSTTPIDEDAAVRPYGGCRLELTPDNEPESARPGG